MKNGKKTTRRDIVLVHWHDTVANSGWCNEDEVLELTEQEQEHLVWSTGVIVKKDKKFIYLAADWGFGDNPYNRALAIPRKMVKTITVIRRWRVK